MANLFLYDVAIAPYLRAFQAFENILQKAKDHAGAGADAFVSARLHEDMYPLSYQVQVVTHMASHTLEQLLPHRRSILVLEDNEKTIDDLIARLKGVLELMQQIEASELEAAHGNVVNFVIPRPGMGGVKTDSTGYSLGFILPNIFFHVTVAYAILRKEGVPVGKTDYWMPFLNSYILSKEW